MKSTIKGLGFWISASLIRGWRYSIRTIKKQTWFTHRIKKHRQRKMTSLNMFEGTFRGNETDLEKYDMWYLWESLKTQRNNESMVLAVFSSEILVPADFWIFFLSWRKSTYYSLFSVNFSPTSGKLSVLFLFDW